MIRKWRCYPCNICQTCFFLWTHWESMNWRTFNRERKLKYDLCNSDWNMSSYKYGPNINMDFVQAIEKRMRSVIFLALKYYILWFRLLLLQFRVFVNLFSLFLLLLQFRDFSHFPIRSSLDIFGKYTLHWSQSFSNYAQSTLNGSIINMKLL